MTHTEVANTPLVHAHRWDGARIVVTGGGSGIGEAIVEHFARAHARVAVIGRTLDKVRGVAERLGRDGGDVCAFEADVRDVREIGDAMAQVSARFGALDLLVNNAGIYRGGSFTETPDAIVDDLIDIDFKGVIHTIRAAVPLLRAGSCIVNVASMSAVRALDRQSIYAAVKAGLVHLGRCLARELAPQGIRVNTVSPGPTNTPILRTVAREEEIPAIRAELAELIPLRRLGEPHEIAEAVAFLAAARFATGAHLVVDGGTVL